MDIMMPDLNGLDAAARVAARHPDVRVIILSMNSAEEYVLQALSRRGWLSTEDCQSKRTRIGHKGSLARRDVPQFGRFKVSCRELRRPSWWTQQFTGALDIATARSVAASRRRKPDEGNRQEARTQCEND